MNVAPLPREYSTHIRGGLSPSAMRRLTKNSHLPTEGPNTSGPAFY